MVKYCIGGNQALGRNNFTNTGKPAHILLMRLEIHEVYFLNLCLCYKGIPLIIKIILIKLFIYNLHLLHTHAYGSYFYYDIVELDL